MPPRTPRTIALEKNQPSAFGDESEAQYDAAAGVPRSVGAAPRERDYRANPVNPPEGQAPASNLKR